MAKFVDDVMPWVEDQLARDPDLRARVDTRMAEFTLRQDLVALREARGLTQMQLATRLGVKQPVVARWESNDGGDLKLSTLVRLTTALGAEVTIRIREVKPKVVGLRGARAARTRMPRPRAALTAGGGGR